MSVLDGDINDISDDTLSKDAEKGKAFLSKLDPMDPQDAEDGRRAMAFIKKAIAAERDPQSAEDGQRVMAFFKKLFGAADDAGEDAPTVAPVAPAPAVVDTSVLTGPRSGLKNFLLESERNKESQ